MENSIVVNELNSRKTDKRNTGMSYVLLSIRKNDKSAFIVRTLIDKLKNELYEIDVYELSAINASNLFNKKGTHFMLKSNEGEEIISVPYLGSKISVSNFLKLVKHLYLANEVFSKVVAEKLNIARHEGTLSKDLRYSVKDGKGDYNCSKGQIAKYVASHSKEKVYSREDAYRGGLNQTQSEGDKLYSLKDKLDKDGDLRYSIYNQYEILAMQWANHPNRKDGETKALYNAQNNTWNELIADKSEDEGYYVSQSIKDTPKNEERIKNLIWGEGYDHNDKKRRTSDRVIKDFEREQREYPKNNDNVIQDGRENGRVSGIHQKQPRSNTSGDTSESDGDKLYSLKDKLGNNGALRYSKKKATYILYSKIGTENVNYIRNQLSKLYNGIENGIADGIGIEKDTTIYVVDTGKDNGDISFGVRTVLEISDEKLRRTYIKELNNDAVSKGHVSDEISSRLGIEYDNGRGSNRRQKFGEELSTNTTKSKDNKERVSREDAHRRGGLNQTQSDVDKLYSLKDKLDKDGDLRYSIYNQYETLAMQWANHPNRKDGDTKALYNAQNNTWNELIADKNEENGYYESQSIKDSPANEEKLKI